MMKRKIKLLSYLTSVHPLEAPSNKKARRLLSSGRVCVNGIPTRSAALKVDSASNVFIIAEETSSIELNVTRSLSQPIPLLPTLIAYNKPCGMLCSFVPPTPICPSTLQSISPPIPSNYHPVGRLDQHSRGLLLFSSDSRLTSHLLDPSSNIPRTYELVVSRSSPSAPTTLETLKVMVSGGVLTDYGTFIADVSSFHPLPNDHVYPHRMCEGRESKRSDVHVPVDSIKRSNDSNEDYEESIELFSVTVAVTEGKKRMVRRLFAALGLFVLDLNRVSYGEVTFIGAGRIVEPGMYRYAAVEEIHFAKECVLKKEMEKKDKYCP